MGIKKLDALRAKLLSHRYWRVKYEPHEPDELYIKVEGIDTHRAYTTCVEVTGVIVAPNYIGDTFVISTYDSIQPITRSQFQIIKWVKGCESN